MKTIHLDKNEQATLIIILRRQMRALVPYLDTEAPEYSESKSILHASLFVECARILSRLDFPDVDNPETHRHAENILESLLTPKVH